MIYDNGYKKPAVLIILKSADKFLLLKRKKEPNRSKYTPVGGKIDPFESPGKAAIRETYEETGIQVSNIKYCGIMVETSPTDYNWICFVYLSEINYIEPPVCNEGELEWISLSKLSDIPIPSTDAFIYHYVSDEIKFMFNVDYDQNLNIIEMKEEMEDVKLI